MKIGSHPMLHFFKNFLHKTERTVFSKSLERNEAKRQAKNYVS